MEGDTVLDIRASDFMEDGTTPPRQGSELSFKNINNTTFVGKYYCVSLEFDSMFEVKVLDEYVTYIFVKGLCIYLQF